MQDMQLPKLSVFIDPHKLNGQGIICGALFHSSKHSALTKERERRKSTSNKEMKSGLNENFLGYIFLVTKSEEKTHGLLISKRKG